MGPPESAETTETRAAIIALCMKIIRGGAIAQNKVQKSAKRTQLLRMCVCVCVCVLAFLRAATNV